MNSKSSVLHCFLCLAKHSFVVKRGRKRKISEPSSRRISVVLKYLLNDKQVFQTGNEDSQLLFDNLLHHFSVKQSQLRKVFCEECEAKVEDILKLHLELEVVQMKLIDKLKCLSEAITTNGLRRLQEVNGQIRDGEEFLQALQGLQEALVKNGSKQFLIPLVFLPKMSAVGAQVISQPNIKQEQMEDNDHFESQESEGYAEDFVGDTGQVGVEEDVKHPLVENQNSIVAVNKVQIKDVTSSKGTMKKSLKTRIASVVKAPKRKQQVLKIDQDEDMDELYNPELPVKSKRGRKPGKRRGKYKKKDPKPKKIRQKKWNVCQICPFKTLYTCTFVQHLREHETPEKIFECNEEPDYCQATFSNQQYYELHLSHHRRTLSFWKCEVCQELTPLPKMVSHMKTHQETVFPCPHCDYCCPSIPSLVEHFRYHKGVDLFCFICSHPLQKSQYRLKEHLCKVHGFKELMYQCEFPGCEKTFTVKLVFEQHMDEHLKKFPCDACGVGFKTEWYLQQHIKAEHERNKPFPCDLCSEAFVCVQKLEKHQVEVHGCPMLKCDQCPKEFTNSNTLNKHKRSYHVDGVEEFVCSICNKKLSCMEGLRRHEKKHFETERDVVCDLCGFATSSQINLKRHMRSHGGEEGKKFICSHCGKRFRENKQLKCHVRIHTGERPYSCDVCGAAFNQLGPLQAHKKRHLSTRLTSTSSSNGI